MGHTSFSGMTEMTQDIATLVNYQLRHNHYPPVPTEMIEPTIKAVEACREGDYERIIETPCEHRIHGFKVPANVIVENYHLEEISYEGEEE